MGSRTVDATRIAEMKAEIYKRGPIVCSMQTEDDGADKPSGPWHCYEGGVYKTPHTYNTTNHVINLLGWGVEEGTGTPYWVGRHSGGTIFGEEGFFRIEAGVNALNSKTTPIGGFTGVFGQHDDNVVVFARAFLPRLPTVLRGGTASLFCYGYTGAGKTHTVFGYEGEPGMYTLAAAELIHMLDDWNEQHPSRDPVML